MSHDLIPESDDIHRHEIEDCPISVQNRQEGWAPFLRIEFLEKKGDEDITLHVCGLQKPLDLVIAIRALTLELEKSLTEKSGDETAADGEKA